MPIRGASNLKKSMDKLDDKPNKELRKVWVKFVSDTITQTPQDTGRAINGWRIQAIEVRGYSA